MTKLRNGLHNINKQNNFCYKKQVVYSGLWFMQHLKWGDEVMKRVFPRIQCSMNKDIVFLLVTFQLVIQTTVDKVGSKNPGNLLILNYFTSAGISTP